MSEAAAEAAAEGSGGGGGGTGGSGQGWAGVAGKGGREGSWIPPPCGFMGCGVEPLPPPHHTHGGFKGGPRTSHTSRYPPQPSSHTQAVAGLRGFREVDSGQWTPSCGFDHPLP